MRATKLGSLKYNVIQLVNITTENTIHKVKYVPKLYVNMLSNKSDRGCQNQQTGRSNQSLMSQILITFDRIHHIKGDDTVSEIRIHVCSRAMVHPASNGHSFDKCLDVNRFHEMLGHCGTDRLQKISNNVEMCESCSIAIERYKNVNKE